MSAAVLVSWGLVVGMTLMMPTVPAGFVVSGSTAATPGTLERHVETWLMVALSRGVAE
jgi:hypothetical protein